jgi:hypothetical protein
MQHKERRIFYVFQKKKNTINKMLNQKKTLSDTELLRQHDGNPINNNNNKTTAAAGGGGGGGGAAAAAAEGLFLHEFQQSILVHHPTINLHKTWSENDI